MDLGIKSNELLKENDLPGLPSVTSKADQPKLSDDNELEQRLNQNS
jgi:hypothetical protein